MDSDKDKKSTLDLVDEKLTNSNTECRKNIYHIDCYESIYSN